MTNQNLTDAEKDAIVRSTRRLDIRRILGGLFLLYGIICTIVGIVHYDSDTKPTGGIHINLWTGIAMIIAGLLFFIWDRFAPVPAEDILGNVENEAEVKAEGEGRA
jgi:prolipoprotein diacylglyceryltransferase